MAQKLSKCVPERISNSVARLFFSPSLLVVYVCMWDDGKGRDDGVCVKVGYQHTLYYVAVVGAMKAHLLFLP